MGDFNVNNKPRVEDTYSVNKLKDMNYFWEHLSLETYVFDSTHRNKNNTQSSLDIFVVNKKLKQLVKSTTVIKTQTTTSDHYIIQKVGNAKVKGWKIK